MSAPYTGRRKILLDPAEVTRENIAALVNKCMITHNFNKNEIDYLWKYYKGDMPILYRARTTRPELTDNVAVTIPYEAVEFMAGYLCGKPIQYIGVNSDESISDKIQMLNSFMTSENALLKNRELFEWVLSTGIGYKMIAMNDGIEDDDEGDAPFEIYILDPRYTFIAYDNTVAERPMFAVAYSEDENKIEHYGVYTKDRYFEVVDGKVVKEQPHGMGAIPIIEYTTNYARLGLFEPCLTMIDALCEIQSSRAEAVSQFVQAYMKFRGVDCTAEQLNQFKEMGAIMIPRSADGQLGDVDFVSCELNQTQVQTLVDNLSEKVNEIIGIPNRGDGSSGDNGIAVIYKDGFAMAEGRASDLEQSFKASEMTFLKTILRICRKCNAFDLRLPNVDVHFTRRNYEANQSKVQSLVQMLGCNKIAPIDAFVQSGMFADPESAVMRGQDYEEKVLAREAQTLEEEMTRENTTDGENME